MLHYLQHINTFYFQQYPAIVGAQKEELSKLLLLSLGDAEHYVRLSVVKCIDKIPDLQSVFQIDIVTLAVKLMGSLNKSMDIEYFVRQAVFQLLNKWIGSGAISICPQMEPLLVSELQIQFRHIFESFELDSLTDIYDLCLTMINMDELAKVPSQLHNLLFKQLNLMPLLEEMVCNLANGLLYIYFCYENC